MSTQINVTVDASGLRQRDKQQRHALRFGKVESENQAKLEARAINARSTDLRTQLLSKDGKPLYSTPIVARTRREELAAFRANVYEWSIEPTTSTQIGVDQFTAVTKHAKVKPLVFYAVVDSSSSGVPNIGGLTSGPGGVGCSLQNTSSGGELRATSADFTIKGRLDFTFETYAKVNGAREGNALMMVEQYTWTLGAQYLTGNQISGLYMRHQIYVHYERQDNNRPDFISVSYGRSNVSSLEYKYIPQAGTSALSTTGYFAGNETPGFNVAIFPGEWFHVAVTRKSEIIYVFINGQLAGYASDATGPSDADADKTTINGVYDYSATSWEVSMAKTRFIRKALYTSNFIPN